MTITTNHGKTLEINWIWVTERTHSIMIEMQDDRPMAEIAADLDGVEIFEKTDAKKPGVKEVYEGYTQIVTMSRENGDGVIRVIIKKGDAA